MTTNAANKALKLLRYLPRVSLANIRDNPGANKVRWKIVLYLLKLIRTIFKKEKRGRGQHGGDTHGDGNKGSGQRQNFMRLGYETGNNPFYKRPSFEPYYKNHQ